MSSSLRFRRGVLKAARRSSGQGPVARRLRPTLEPLEDRRLFAADFCNPFNELDVNDDGTAGPLDVMLIFDALKERGPRRLDEQPAAAGRYIDVNADEFVTPHDALLIINHLNMYGEQTVPLVVGIAPASDLNGNGVVLRSAVTIQGQSVPGARVRLAGPAGVLHEAATNATGQFAFEVDVIPGENAYKVTAVDAQRRSGRAEQIVRLGDSVLDWNASLLNIVRDWTTSSNDPYPNRIVTSQPPMVARNLAMIHAALYDAWNAFERTHAGYSVELEPPAGASPLAAAAAAAHRVASHLYRESDELAVFDATLAETLTLVPDGVSREQGVAFGRQVGDSLIASRADDGAGTNVVYTPGTDPGDWQRTFPDFFPPLLPQWPQVTPFVMESADQFRPPAPPALESSEYAAAVDEVMRLGRLDSAERTADQTEIAIFWADGGGTFTPAGHWNQIAADVSLAQQRGIAENARLFALLNLAMADAGINCWDAKYAYSLWRPVDAIRKADLDSNPSTSADASWLPLVRTPPFPSYTSGHSTFSGAAEIILSAFFGSETQFTSRSDGQTGFTQRPLSEDRVTIRSFENFREAAEEASHSRIYGGIHYSFDSETGLAAGRAIAEYVLARIARPRS